MAERGPATPSGAPPSATRPAIAFGMAVILLGLGTFMAWAATASISSAVVATGTVKVLSSRKKVQSEAGGTVLTIDVKDGQQVKVGDELIRLDATRARATLDMLQGNNDLAAASVARLRAEFDAKDQVTFPQELEARSDDPSVASIMRGQIRLFEARRKALSGQVEVTREQIRQLGEQTVGLAAQTAAEASQIDLIERELRDMKQLLKKKLVPKSRVLALEREAARLRGQMGDYEAQIAAAQAQIAAARLQLLQQRTTFEKEVSDEIGTMEANLYSHGQKLLDARHTLDQTVIRATENGTVVGLAVHTVGGVVQPGDTLLEIVPAEDNLVIEAQIRPEDVDNLAIGLDAETVFSGLSRRELTRLLGQVTYVSADALEDTRLRTSYFSAHVSLSGEAMEKLGDGKLLPGMPAQVYIKTGERTPLAYLMEPLTDSFARAWREP